MKFVQLILRIFFCKIVATRYQILRLKYTKFDFGWGSAPDTAGELTALPQTLLDLGATLRQGRGWAGEVEGKREGKGRKGEVERREMDKRAPKLLLNQGPSETCYATESLLKY